MTHDPTTIADTVGAFEIGTFADTLLFGILCLQCYIFLHNNERASRLMQYSIWTIWLLNTGHLICSIHVTYWYTVTNFGNVLEDFTHQPRSSAFMTLFGVMSNLMVQVWFIFRIWILSDRNRRLMVVLSTLTGIAFGVAASFALITIIPSPLTATEESVTRINWLIYFTHSVDILANLALTIALCYYLWKAKMTTLSKTRSVVEWTLTYTVNTGLLAMIFPITTIILRLTRPDDMVFFSVYVPYSAIYSNALLGSLNARDWVRHDDDPVTIHLSDLDNSVLSTPNGTRATINRGNHHAKSSSATTPLTVKVESETHTQVVKFSDGYC
ncbi:uncharacterized protein PHACADRAFT_260864 [Phanerochaete carnosa HHB-10118-sp]|uniref:DUF6534 domain-containing protein n=1 Tax=Phanerochaete carnosa (strain HHB-10118-sp) TaxID=650164 RepID=K5VM00_PHACS|nr:uncharacterized protein PHACADRAFT_260864 [Phanerochaete carnosa HHB-10118-sp]EKM52458.1 hypothetical protein PHACADRAFT_260864 [Phanerochaete carnosa HHB-10118-sp]